METEYEMTATANDTIDLAVKNQKFHELMKSKVDLKHKLFFFNKPENINRWQGLDLPYVFYWLRSESQEPSVIKTFVTYEGIQLPNEIKKDVVEVFNEVFNSKK